MPESSRRVRSSRDLRGDLAPRLVLLEHELHQQAVLLDRPRALDQPRLEHLVPALQTLRVVSSGHALCNRLKHTQTLSVRALFPGGKACEKLSTIQLRSPSSATASRRAESYYTSLTTSIQTSCLCKPFGVIIRRPTHLFRGPAFGLRRAHTLRLTRRLLISSGRGVRQRACIARAFSIEQRITSAIPRF